MTKFFLHYIFAPLLLFVGLYQPVFADAGDYAFIENKGQWPSNVLYSAKLQGGYLFVEKDGLKYHFYDADHYGKLLAKHAHSEYKDVPDDYQNHV